MSPVDHAEQLIKKGGHVHLMGIGGVGMAGIGLVTEGARFYRFPVVTCSKIAKRTGWTVMELQSLTVMHLITSIRESIGWFAQPRFLTRIRRFIVLWSRESRFPVGERFCQL